VLCRGLERFAGGVGGAEVMRGSNHAKMCREECRLKLDDAAECHFRGVGCVGALGQLCRVQKHDRLGLGVRPLFGSVCEGLRRTRCIPSRQAGRGCQYAGDEIALLKPGCPCGRLPGGRGVPQLRQSDVREQFECGDPIAHAQFEARLLV